jgi:hypothetical protein
VIITQMFYFYWIYSCVIYTVVFVDIILSLVMFELWSTTRQQSVQNIYTIYNFGSWLIYTLLYYYEYLRVLCFGLHTSYVSNIIETSSGVSLQYKHLLSISFLDFIDNSSFIIIMFSFFIITHSISTAFINSSD